MMFSHLLLRSGLPRERSTNEAFFNVTTHLWKTATYFILNQAVCFVRRYQRKLVILSVILIIAVSTYSVAPQLAVLVARLVVGTFIG